MDIEKLKYPVGKFQMPKEMTPALRQNYLDDLATLPEKLEATISSLNDSQLDTPYRPGGWTVRQVVHHFADSHINAFCRIKLVLTEESPTIKPYHEGLWAEMSDYASMPVSQSISILHGLHKRMVHILSNLNEAELEKYYVHPEYGKTFTLDTVIALYGWHCNHHLAHISELKKRNYWD